MNSVENSIMTMLALRLDDGVRKYGPFTEKPDSRRMLRECVEELADAVVYLLKRCLELENAEAEIENRQGRSDRTGGGRGGVHGTARKAKGRVRGGGKKRLREAGGGRKAGKGGNV